MQNHRPERNAFFYRNLLNAKIDVSQVKTCLLSLIASTPENLLGNISSFLKLINEQQNPIIRSLFYGKEFDLIWKNLIAKHSTLLSNLNLALGRQEPSGQLNSFEQLLGIYYFSIALNSESENQNQQAIFASKMLRSLEIASFHHSIQAMLLLRFHYINELNNGNLYFDPRELKTIIENMTKKMLTPGYILYGEFIIYLARHAIQNQSSVFHLNKNNEQNSFNQLTNFFKEGIFYCYLGDFLKDISQTEINNAYGVTDGSIPYSNGVFFESGDYDDMDDFCRKMRSYCGLVLDMEEIKNEAQMQATELKKLICKKDNDTYTTLSESEMLFSVEKIFSQPDETKNENMRVIYS